MKVQTTSKVEYYFRLFFYIQRYTIIFTISFMRMRENYRAPTLMLYASRETRALAFILCHCRSTRTFFRTVLNFPFNYDEEKKTRGK